MSTIEERRDHRGSARRLAEGRSPDSRDIRRWLRYALIRPAGSAARRGAITTGLAVGSALLASSGVIHLQLWAMGYRTISTIGPLFLLQGVAGISLAALLLLWRRLLVVVVGAGFMVATIGGLLTSVYLGLFGFMDTFAAPYAGLSLVLESAGAIILGVIATVLLRSGSRRDQRAHSEIHLKASVS
jgi:hypothetical protein